MDREGPKAVEHRQAWTTKLVAAVLGLMVGVLVLPAGASSPKTRLVSKTSAGSPADGPSLDAAISGNGRLVAFESRAANLPGGDGETIRVYVHNHKTNKTKLVSRRSDGPKADGQSGFPDISANGRFVAFHSRAANLPGGDGSILRTYVHDRKTGRTKLVSRNSDGAKADGGSFNFPAISANGRFVAFESRAANLPGGDGTTSRVYVHDRKTRKTKLVSKTSSGAKPSRGSRDAAISDDGRFVAFQSRADNLPGGDGNIDRIYVHERRTGKTKLVSKNSAGAKADGASHLPAISADGRFVAFQSRADNLPGGDGNIDRIYVHDRETGKTKLVSRASDGRKANGSSRDAAISADGRFVTFASVAANLPGGDGTTFHVFVHDRQTGKTRLLSRTSGGARADGNSFGSDISADGRFAAFESDAANLPGGDGANFLIYRRGPL